MSQPTKIPLEDVTISDFARKTPEPTRSLAPLPLSRQIQDLAAQIVRGRMFYDLWWLLQGPPLADHINGMNLYPEFFRFNRHGLLVAMVVQSMIPFDTTKNALSFASLLKSLQKRDDLKSVVANVRAVLAEADHVVPKLRLIRHECFAHRSRDSSYDDVWTRAELRPSDVYQLQDVSLRAVNQLIAYAGNPEVEFHDGPRADFERLLARLEAEAAS